MNAMKLTMALLAWLVLSEWQRSQDQLPDLINPNWH
jgi:hypothetical protein